MSPKEIHDDFIKTLEDESLLIARWNGLLNLVGERECVEDYERSGRPKEATTDGNVELVHSLIMCDRRRRLRDIARQIGIRLGAVQSILIVILGISKLSARWVPRMLTKDQRSRLDIPKYLLSVHEDDPEEFMRRVVAQDEMWVHHFAPEATKYAMEVPWLTPPKKFKSSSTGNVMTSIFCDIQGVIMCCFEEGHKINSAYNAEENLRWLRQELVNKRGKLTRGVLLLQYFSPVPTSQVMAAAAKCSFEVLPHPPYFSNLAPHFCFQIWKLTFVVGILDAMKVS